ncbi:Plant lipid transfer protein/Par allergen [Corchorus olitorius]|uniref:Plant lipid transfer protein/Par allergen n=1 Tax=Corchorus olitorius TaxID=93759 RepID=A0A1R3HUP3_9ROSI|nr:Plant lipid transfer protein/Par allergen [Corchorus olitorius]
MEFKRMKGLPLCVGVLMSLVVLDIAMANSMTCQQAVTTLLPCQPFLTGQVPNPTVPCCIAVAKINEEATTTQTHRDLCECLKKAAPTFGVKPEKAKVLPDLCHVSVPVPIDPSIDCQQ